jgi:hypothetical protein
VNEKTDFIVLETAIDQISVFHPMKHTRDAVDIGEEDRR